MGFRFRKSINLGGGFRINLSKSGIGYSWGTKGARITKTAKGTTRTTVGIPGTGLSYSTESSNAKKSTKLDKKYTSSTSNQSSCSIPKTTEGGHKMKFLDTLKKHWRWFLVGILALFLITSIPSFSGFLAFLGIALVIPIPKWQSLVEKYVKGKLKNIGAGILAILALFTYPTAPSSSADAPDSSIVVESTEPVHIHNFIDATCLKPKTCSNCGETEGDALGHTWIDATCLEPEKCSVCGITEGSLGTHVWQDATCLAPKTCATCAVTEGELAEHCWQDATCITPQTCSVCNITEGEVIEHSWVEATCLAPLTCSVCKTTEGDIGPHNWLDATCLSPMKCSVCNAKEGELGYHNWTEATCKTPKTCSVCKTQEGNRVDHYYIDHVCVYCEKSEPTVWVPYSGARYHSRSSCSNMIDPSEVPISTAIAWGYTPCGRCY